MKVELDINREKHTVDVEPRTSLLDCLRDKLLLTGAHAGCEHGVCGACTVLIDGAAVRSCLMFAVQADGYAITTIEGLSPGPGELSPIQDAFCETHGMQCGYCTPAMILAAHALLSKNSQPTREEIVDAISGNICRCTGYAQIVEAIALAAERMRAADQLVEDDAEREHVGAVIELVAEALLGRHVARLAAHDARDRVDVRDRRRRDPEVHDLHRAVVADHDVRQRDVAVDQAQRPAARVAAAVRVIEPRGGRGDDRGRDRVGQAAAGVRGGGQQLAEVGAVDVLHREVVAAVRHVDLEHRRDVLVVEQGADPRLVEEQRAGIGIHGALLVQDLDRDLALEPADALVASQVDVGHPTLCDGPDQPVRAEPVQGSGGRTLACHHTSYERRDQLDSHYLRSRRIEHLPVTPDPIW